MHFEILVEDQSGKKALEILIPNIIGSNHTYRIISYKGIGRIPKRMNSHTDAEKRILLDNLPRLLNGYGKTFNSYSDSNNAAVIVICDLDNKCLKEFRNELLSILNRCNPAPDVRFCIAIEEGEAWFLGDPDAIRKAYPGVKNSVIGSYVNDSICGTWEKLADAVYPEGSAKLKKLGYQTVGMEKSRWAEKISPFMDIENNNSPSFCYFRDKIRELADRI